jgi:hypothetical protein
VSDRDEQEERGGQTEQQAETSGERSIGARQAVERAVSYMAEMTGQEPEIVIAVEPDDGRWHVQMELLELARVPHNTDVLGCYEVTLDADGEPAGYHRTRRYHRAYVGER